MLTKGVFTGEQFTNSKLFDARKWPGISRNLPYGFGQEGPAPIQRRPPLIFTFLQFTAFAQKAIHEREVLLEGLIANAELCRDILLRHSRPKLILSHPV